MSIIRIIVVCVLCIGASINAIAEDLTLWYQQPAKEWTAGLPLGNGQLMAVVQGGIQRERIQLNEESVWTGKPMERDTPDGAKYLAPVRQLMFDGKYAEAQRLVEEKMLGIRLDFGMHTYQTLGNLELVFTHPQQSAAVSNYRRELNLDNAVAKVSYTLDNATYTREVFVSPVDQALIVHLTCDKPGRLTFDAKLSRPGGVVETLAPDRIAMHGLATGRSATGWRGVNYEAQLQVTAFNGTLSEIKKGIRIEHADTVILRLAAATNYRSENPRTLCEKRLSAAGKKSYPELREAHVTEHQRLFRRVSLDLGDSDAESIPTDERLKAFREGAVDPQLIGLYFQFGRYLLISSSRPGSMAVNLWGKWASSLDPAYNADYHININIQMNYWPAEVTNLTECHEPFFDLLDSLRTRGRITAQKTYGARGFVAHHATDAWYYTAAIGNTPYGMWPMAPAWSCQHLWEHYLFGGDREYLAKRSYPIMKEAAEFFLDYLVEHPKTGYMVTGPSTSPENRFNTAEGEVVSLSMAPTMDNQLLRDLFSNTIEASKVLDIDAPFRRQLENLQSRLMPMQIGSDGRLMEWSEPFREHNPGHRHISHLWGLSPGNQITPDGTPGLAEAARKSLDFRVANGAAASPEYRGITAWIMNSYTRLWDGDTAYKHLSTILAESSWPNLFAVGVRGRDRKVFETDVNFGATAAIAEMMLQSHTGAIHLLPALPSALSTGSVKGLRARDAFEVDLAWENGALKTVTIRSLKGNPCAIKYGNRQIEFETSAGQEYRYDGTLQQL
jgi:alpha-L-fucosidase 2